MRLYSVRLTDGSNQDLRLVVARRQSHAASWGELQAARASRISGVTWRLVAVAELREAEDAVDHDRKWGLDIRPDP